MRYGVLLWSFVLFVVTLAIPLAVQRAEATPAPLEDRRQQVVWGKYGEPSPSAPPQAVPDAPAAPSVWSPDLLINEVAPVGGPGKPAWIELIVPTQRTYLPLVMRNATGNASSSAAPAQPAPLLTTGWILRTDDGRDRTPQVYTLPIGFASASVGARILISVGVAGATDLDFSDGVGGAHWSTAPSLTIALRGGAVALYRDQVTPTNMVDFVAWGDYGGALLDDAAGAGLWAPNSVLSFDPGFGGEEERNAPWLPNQSLGRYAVVWASYLARQSSKGAPNPVPMPMRTNRPDGSAVESAVFGAAWTPVPNARQYEFQLSTNPSFTNILVNERLSDPGWYPDSPLPDGPYWWRVRTVVANGAMSPYFGPFQQNSSTFSIGGVSKTLLENNMYRMQRKDTTMLDIGGGPGNANGSGSPRFGTRNRWDGPHVDEATGFPTFSWNGYDNLACVRASVAMMTLYYGGNLSVDRVTYFIFEQNASNSYLTKGIPEGDMGFGKGASAEAALEWALNVNSTSQSYCPNPPDNDTDDDYTCNSDDPDTAPFTVTFTTIKNLIDSGRPMIRSSGGHATVVDGYMTDINGKQWVRQLDPVPTDDSNCVPGECSGFEWWEFDALKFYIKAIRYVSDGETTDARSDEATIWLDSDGDGINDFDESVRFNTDPYDKDTDDDWVNDKEDIAEYVFDRTDKYDKRLGDYFQLGFGPGGYFDMESDVIRKELDWDHDGDAIPDGCEDVNRDGRYGLSTGANSFILAGETNNFNPGSYQPCVPKPFVLWDPRSSHPGDVGSHLAPDPLVATVLLWLPPPQTPKPLYSKDNFTVSIGSLNAPVLATAKNGIAYYLLVQPPPQGSPGLYDMRVIWHDLISPTLSVSDTNLSAVKYDPPPLAVPTSTVRSVYLALDTSRYLTDTALLSATQNAARLFASQWGAQDRLGLITFGAGAAIQTVPLAQVGSGALITTVKNAINAIAPTGDSALGSALNLAQSGLDSSGDPNGVFAVAAFAAGQPSVGPYLSTFFNDTSFDPDSFALASPDGPCLCAGDAFSRTQLHMLGMGAKHANFFAGLERAADATGGSLGATGVPSVTSAHQPALLANRLANDFKYAAERMRGEQRLLEAWGSTSGLLERDVYSVTLDSGKSIAFVLNYGRANVGSLTVFRPDGSEVMPGDSGVVYRADATHDYLRVTSPPTGTWRIETSSSNLLNSTEYLLVVSAEAGTKLEGGDPVFRGGSAFVINPQLGPLPLGATVADTAPITGALITATLLYADGGLAGQVRLLDNGTGNDGIANDGGYAGVFTPTLYGTYILKYVATGIDHAGRKFQRHDQVAFTIPRPAAYVYSEHDLPQTFSGYRALLAESSIPLEAIAGDQVSITNWSRYALAIISPDSAMPGKDWLTPQARTAISVSGLPVLGLYNGGYELFRNYGLDLGTNVTRTALMTQSLPVDANHPVWKTPYPLGVITPYRLYTASAGLNLDLPSLVLGVTKVGLLPGTPRVNVATEDGRFGIWGWRLGPAQMTLDGTRAFKNLVHLLMK